MVINRYIFKKINICLKDILGIFSGQTLVLFILFTKLVDLPFIYILWREIKKENLQNKNLKVIFETKVR